MDWQTIPTGLLDILIAGLTKKFGLKYSGIVQSEIDKVGPAAYYGSEQKMLVLVFKGNPTSEYAVVKNTEAPDTDVDDYAEKYGDMLASFSDVNHVSFQKKAAGDQWETIGGGFSSFYHIPSKNLTCLYGVESGWGWECVDYPESSGKLSMEISYTVETESETVYNFPKLGLAPILANPKKINVSISNTLSLSYGTWIRTEIVLFNNTGGSETIVYTGSDVDITLPNPSKLQISIIIEPTDGRIDIHGCYAVNYVKFTA